MKVAFNRTPRRSPWGGGAHFATTFADYLVANGHEVVYGLETEVDRIVMLDPRWEAGGFGVDSISVYQRMFPNVKVLHRVNDTGATRGGDELDNCIIDANRLVADATVFISKWVADYFAAKGLNPRNQTVITNGCDANFFHPSPSSTEWRERGWQRRNSWSETNEFYPPGPDKPRNPLKLVTHHWSDNPAKGLDLYKHIDDLIGKGAPIEFTYVGRYPKEHAPKHTKVVAPLYGAALGGELRQHDVYVTAARWEACGSHHVEGAACGLPVVYHKDGGGVVEMCRRYGEAIGDPSELKEALTKIKNYYKSYMWSAESADLSSDTMCEKYLRALGSL